MGHVQFLPDEASHSLWALWKTKPLQEFAALLYWGELLWPRLILCSIHLLYPSVLPGVFFPQEIQVHDANKDPNLETMWEIVGGMSGMELWHPLFRTLLQTPNPLELEQQSGSLRLRKKRMKDVSDLFFLIPLSLNLYFVLMWVLSSG